MSKCTVVSTLPWQLNEPKYGLNPSYYVVPAAPKNDISILVVGDGYHHFTIPMSNEKTPPMKIIDPSDKIAKCLIDDYIGSCLEISHSPNEEGITPIPGMFWIEGAMTKKEVELRYFSEVDEAKKRTAAWFVRLLKLADDDWQKYHQHKFITDIQRSACGYLGQEREWNFNVLTAKTALCWACKKSIHPAAMLCDCGAILDMKAYEKAKSEGRFVAVGK